MFYCTSGLIIGVLVMDIKPCLVFISIFVSVLAAQMDQISAKLGQKVILPYTAPSNDRVTTVEWKRTEMDTEYVLLYRNSKYDPAEQSSCFSKRVELQDEQMKNGNMSLVLKDMRADDSGIYESRITQKDKNDKTRHLDGEPICIFQLSVAAASVLSETITAEPRQNVAPRVAPPSGESHDEEHKRHHHGSSPGPDQDGLTGVGLLLLPLLLFFLLVIFCRSRWSPTILNQLMGKTGSD